jgi:hypothetical protein
VASFILPETGSVPAFKSAISDEILYPGVPTRPRRDIRLFPPVQKFFKKVKKRLVSPRNLP